MRPAIAVVSRLLRRSSGGLFGALAAARVQLLDAAHQQQQQPPPGCLQLLWQQHASHYAAMPADRWQRHGSGGGSRNSSSSGGGSRNSSVGGGLHPAQLTAQLMSAKDAGRLLQLVVAHSQQLNHVHVVAALNAAAQLWPSTASPAGSGGEQLLGRQQLRQLVLQLAGPFCRLLPRFGPRELSSGLRSFASCGVAPPGLLDAVASQLASWDGLAGASVPQTVNIAYSLAKLRCVDRRLWSAVAAAAKPEAAQLSAGQVWVLAWALARGGHADEGLLQGLAARASCLLDLQLLEQQQQQPGAAAGQRQQQPDVAAGQRWQQQPKRRQQRQQQGVGGSYERFTAGGLAGLCLGFGSLGWPDPSLAAKVAATAASPQLVHELPHKDAANLLKGLAAAAGTAAPAADSSSNSGSSSSDSGAAGGQAGNTAGRSGAALAQQLWPDVLAITAAALRRSSEGDAQSAARLLWSLAALHQQQAAAAAGADAAAAAAETTEADAARLFGQLCSSLQMHWQRQGMDAPSVVMTAWALVRAHDSGLAMPSVAAAGSGAGDASTQHEQLASALASGVARLAQQQGALSLHHIADLAAALQRLHRAAIGGGGLLVDDGGDAAAGGAARLRADIAAAAQALAAEARQQAAAPGVELRVGEVSRLAGCFAGLQVTDASVYAAVLAHWTLAQLQAATGDELLGAARAARLLPAGALPDGVLHALLEAVIGRWQQLGSVEQLQLRGALCGVDMVELSGELADRVQAVLLQQQQQPPPPQQQQHEEAVVA